MYIQWKIKHRHEKEDETVVEEKTEAIVT